MTDFFKTFSRQKEAPRELSEQVQQIRIEDEQLDCCVKPLRADLLYIIQTPAMINKICKMATRVPPTEHGMCTYDDVISPWIFTTFNEDLGSYFGKSRTHYYHMVERVYKIFAIRLLNLVATEPFGCQMLLVLDLIIAFISNVLTGFIDSVVIDPILKKMTLLVT